MNAKLKKVLSDMKKIEGKMELLQEKWEELNKQKTELENLEIIGLIRGAKITTENLNDVITAYRSKSGVPFSSEKQEEN
ncbi:MAG: DUF4315 family protein [Clostridiales bacterium]|nr:DUF4315 family protein [Clostridiales bacterium]